MNEIMVHDGTGMQGRALGPIRIWKSRWLKSI